MALARMYTPITMEEANEQETSEAQSISRNTSLTCNFITGSYKTWFRKIV